VGGLGKEAEKYLRPSLDEDITEEEELEEGEEEEEDEKAIKVTKKAKKVVSGAKVSVDDKPEDDPLLEEELSPAERRQDRKAEPRSVEADDKVRDAATDKTTEDQLNFILELLSEKDPYEMEETVVEAKRPLPVDRFKGKKPEIPKATLEKIRPEVEEDVDAVLSEREINLITDPDNLKTVDSPEPIELPTGKKKDETDLKKIKTSKVLSDSVLRTQKALGTDFKSPEGELILTEEALEDSSSDKPDVSYKLEINPNTNRATLLDSASGDKIKTFAIGTGDTTGTRYGKKFFTPVGTWHIISKVPYKQVEKSFGPLWLGLDISNYGVHGPHSAKDISETGEEFVNEGFVSHGCIRFLEEDALELGRFLDIGAEVKVLPYTTRPEHRGPLRISAPTRGRGAPEVSVRGGSR
jgi:hypothetical protein